MHISLFDDSNIQDAITYHNRLLYLIYVSLLGFYLCIAPQCLLFLIVQLLFTELQTQLSNGSEDAVLGNVRQRAATTSYYCFIVCTYLICDKRIKYDVARCWHIK